MIDLNTLAHSHDILEIVHLGGASCVRKTFTHDVERATRNVRKQQAFKTLHTGVTRIAAAEVLSFISGDGRAELTMPYVEGLSGAMFAVHGTRLVAETVSEAMSTLVYAQLARSIDTPCDTAILVEKATDIARRTSDPVLKELAQQACARLQELPATIVFPLGPCHGDLTLGNIILNPVSGITVIDFLDTFLETPLQDVTKLKQDFVYGWSFRACTQAVRIKAEILCQRHAPHVLAQVDRLYGVQVKALTLLTLLRIAPYVRDALTRDWLDASLRNCLASEFS